MVSGVNTQVSGLSVYTTFYLCWLKLQTMQTNEYQLIICVADVSEWLLVLLKWFTSYFILLQIVDAFFGKQPKVTKSY